MAANPIATATISKRLGHMDDDQEQDGYLPDGYLPMICPVTGAPCMTEQDEFCEDYGCARRAGIDVDLDLIA